jgi:hypothetical protein
MNVVFHPTHLQRGTFDIVESSGEVGMQFRLDGSRENAFAVFGAEHQMNQDAGQ